MDDVEITVLMSVYNTPIEQLKQAIESILNQTYINFEFLIICDGIKNEDIDFIKGFKDERITLEINDKNIGLVKSLNKGLKIAKGKYIARMDTDDIAYPDRLEKEIKFMKENPQYAIVAGKANFFDESGIYGTSKIYGEIQKKDVFT